MEFSQILSAAQAIDASVVEIGGVDRPALAVPADSLLPLMTCLRAHAEWGFDMLSTHTAVDWVDQEEIELIYQLNSLKTGMAIMVSCRIPRAEPKAPSVSSLWSIAQWQEREVYDLFGVLYEGHPDLRRIFLDDDWDGFPLRKDYKDDFMLECPR